MAGPFFSVVIPTYNRCEAVLRCLDALARQSLEMDQFEVIVVVDGSTDGTAARLGSLTPPYDFRFIGIENGGAGHARNAGAKMARGEYIAFTEDDVTPDTDWLLNARAHLRQESHAVLEGRTVYEGSTRSVRRHEPPGIFSFIPCNVFVLRTAFDASGGYDPEFFDRKRGLYFREDSDLGFRLLDAGHAAAIAQDVIVSHPPQFESLSACIRHARRYVFDPLLYKRHPVRYRKMIEVKYLAGLTVHRPQHSVALLDLAAVVVALAGLVEWGTAWTFAGLAVSLACAFLFRLKYQGRNALRIDQLHSTFGFWVVPFVYLFSLVRGCFRYRTAGVLI